MNQAAQIGKTWLRNILAAIKKQISGSDLVDRGMHRNMELLQTRQSRSLWTLVAGRISSPTFPLPAPDAPHTGDQRYARASFPDNGQLRRNQIPDRRIVIDRKEQVAYQPVGALVDLIELLEAVDTAGAEGGSTAT
jgi:hypothetical protein